MLRGKRKPKRKTDKVFIEDKKVVSKAFFLK